MILCKDCRWFIVSGAKCARDARAPDYVFGAERGNFDAQITREDRHACGPEAKWFEIIPVAA